MEQLHEIFGKIMYGSEALAAFVSIVYFNKIKKNVLGILCNLSYFYFFV